MELTIEKLVYGGDGLARLPSDARPRSGKAVFVPYTLPGERVEATITDQKSGFARARLDKVVAPSALRASPPCPYFGSCGGCHYQHASYEEQPRLKAEILREQLLRTAKCELETALQIHPSPPLHYRNRTRFHLHHQPEFEVGYFRHGSHELLAVQECPISSLLINRVLAEIRKLGTSGSIPDEIDEIELFSDATDEQALVEIYLGQEAVKPERLKEFAGRLAESMAQIGGIVSFARLSARPFPPKHDLLHGSSTLDYKTRAGKYRVSAGAFFQTNRHLIEEMIDLVVSGRRGKLALDLYSGVGLFALPLAQAFERVIAVESYPISAADLRHNLPPNATMSSRNVEDYLENSGRKGSLRPDLVVVDPPRAGLGSALCKQLSALSPSEIVYVSCDPATLARDLKQLLADTWRISAMHLIDLFPQTFHIETITVLQR